MAKSTSYDSLGEVQFIIDTNVAVPQSDGTVKYQPAVVTARVNAITTEGGQRPVSKTLTVGSLSTTPKTIQQLYTSINGVNSSLGTLLKDLITEAISVDPSA